MNETARLCTQALRMISAPAALIAISTPCLSQVRVNMATINGAPEVEPTTNNSFQVSLSSNGRYVAFSSGAFDFDLLDTNAPNPFNPSMGWDVFLHDRDLDGNGIFDEPGGGTTLTTMISRSWNPPGPSAPGNSTCPMVSGDGQSVVFETTSEIQWFTPAPFACGGFDCNGATSDIIVYSAAGNTMTWVSVDSGGSYFPLGAYDPSISDDGTVIAFYAMTQQPPSMPLAGEVYLHTLGSGSVLMETVTHIYPYPDVSGDGASLVWVNLNTSAIRVARRWSSTTGTTSFQLGAIYATISDNGNQVAVEIDSGDVNVWDFTTGSAVLVTTIPNAAKPRISGDGDWVTYLQGNATRLHQVSTGWDTLIDRGNGDSSFTPLDLTDCASPDVIPGGSTVGFYSTSSDLVASDTNGFMDIFVFNNPQQTFCEGYDGSLASCPCANPGNIATGCDIAQATGGVGLTVVAQTTSPSNGATLVSSGYPVGSTPATVVIRSTSLDSSAPVVSADGLRCVATTPFVRLGSTLASGGTATHVIPHGTSAGSGTFYYQAWLRNLPKTYCDPFQEFNWSSGVTMQW